MPESTPWERLSAPLDPADISWRINSKPKSRDGRFFALFVGYIEAGTVRKRLDSVAPGDWDLIITELRETADSEGVPQQAFKARVQVHGVIREDVGIGPDYKQAATDAFKRAATRFGIGHELYDLQPNWVEVDGDGKYAKCVEDPQTAYDRRYGAGGHQANPTPATPNGGPNGTPTRVATTNGESGTNASRKMPFGKNKGKPLSDLPDDELRSTVQWCRQKDAEKFKDLIAACEAELTTRNGEELPLNDPPEDDEIPF